MARPTIMTDNVVKKLEEAFLLGCTDLEACFYAGISKQTLYNYQDANPGYIDRKEQLKTNPVFLARKTVVKEIQEKGELALKFLERKKKDEFSTSTDVNLGGQNGENPIDVNNTITLSPEDAYKKLLGK